MVFCGIHLRTISQEVLMKLIFIFNMYSEITYLQLLPHLPETNELKAMSGGT